MDWHTPIRTTLDRALDVLLRRSLEVRLRRAVARGQVLHLSALLEGGEWPVDRPFTPLPECVWGPRRRQHTGHTLIHAAAAAGQLGAVELLLSRGADPNVRTHWGVSPLHYAAMNGHAAVLALLAQRGGRLDDRLPSSSTFCDDDYLGPTSPELFESHNGAPYTGSEYAQARSSELDVSLPAASASASRRRL